MLNQEKILHQEKSLAYSVIQKNTFHKYYKRNYENKVDFMSNITHNSRIKSNHKRLTYLQSILIL